jgi:hypothetical protein
MCCLVMLYYMPVPCSICRMEPVELFLFKLLSKQNKWRGLFETMKFTYFKYNSSDLLHVVYHHLILAQSI